MEPSSIQEKQKPSSGLKYKVDPERIKKSFWGASLSEGLLISGMFLMVEYSDFSRETIFIIGLIAVIISIFFFYINFLILIPISYRINKIMEKAQLSFGTRNYIKSLNYSEKIIRFDQRYAPAWNIKGAALSKLEKYEDAMKCYDKALEIDGRNTLAWYNKGTALSKLGKYEDAIECYDKALEIDMNYASAWYNKASLESLRNNKQESIKYLKKAIELDEMYIEESKLEPDFDNIRDSDEFKELIG